MKHKSRLFLLIALVLAGIGVILLIAGALVSKAQGQSLFAADLGNGDKGYVYEYEKIDGKLKIDADNVEITVVGGADENRIEVANFNENLFTYTENNAMITLKESDNVGSAFAFWDGETAFNGLRFIPKLARKQKNKAIRVYVKKDEGFNEIIIHTENGKVNISDVDFAAVYTFDVTGSSVVMNNVKSAVSLTVTDKTGQENITLNGVSAKKITLDVLKSDVSGLVTADVLDVWCNSGSAKLTYAPLTFEGIYFELNSNARILLDGAEFMTELKYPKDKDGLEVGEDNEPLYAEVGITGDDLTIELETPLDAIEIKTE